ncbi:MAG TPA: MFS transporter [Acidimicrobiia bacterium]|nr:MFS transporter [Acidimicrobiia bacterium]
MRSPALLRRTFSAFSVRNFRLYFVGQVVSVSGTWMQRVAQSWLVLELTGSGSAVGGVTAFQFLPILLLAPMGGLVADRMDKRRVLYLSQSLAGLTALILGTLVLTGKVELWMVYALALTLGLVDAFDNPARNALVMEIVGRSRLTNAVGLNSVLINGARILGPAVGGVLIVTVGIAACFLINAASYLGLIVALMLMREDQMERPVPERRKKGQLREAFRYVRSEPVLAVPLAMMAVVGLFTNEFEVTLPLMARFTFGGDADTFGLMFAAMGVGAVIGGLWTATRGERPGRALIRLCYGLAVAVAAAAFAPWLWLEVVTLVAVGITSTSFLTLGNSVLQLECTPAMRGRVVALRAVAILGARPLGAPLVGWIGEHLGPRVGLAVGAAAALLVGVWAQARVKRYDSERAQAA